MFGNDTPFEAVYRQITHYSIILNPKLRFTKVYLRVEWEGSVFEYKLGGTLPKDDSRITVSLKRVELRRWEKIFGAGTHQFHAIQRISEEWSPPRRYWRTIIVAAEDVATGEKFYYEYKRR